MRATDTDHPPSQPPIYCSPDASLEKFRETLTKVDKAKEDSKDEDPNIFITGDLNFRPEVAEWKRADDIVVPMIK